MDFSILNYYGMQLNRCGYCKGTKCSKAHGMHAYTLLPEDYQALIDRGWRRSGKYCYKPHNQTTCCPSYTIKCDALEFKLTKSHKKILKRMNRFLRDGKKEKNEQSIDQQQADACDFDEPKEPQIALRKIDLSAISKTNSKTKKDAPAAQKRHQNVVEKQGNDIVDGSSTSRNAKTTSAEISQKQMCDKNVAEPTSTPAPIRKKAKQMRLERRKEKLIAKGLNDDEMDTGTGSASNVRKTLSDFIAETTPNDKHKLKLVFVHTAKLKAEQESFRVFEKYQIKIHNDPPERVTPARLQRFLYETPLKLKLVHVNSNEFTATLSTTYALYEKYQTLIHNDKPESVEDYLTFLANSPLKHKKPENGPPQGYGSFHQQYWLDDKLIAVGVIDILPHCLSSVYFFYDPDYSFLSLGTYASLREIEFVQQVSQVVPALRYYYMGFYIHSCPKMRYKGKLVPSELLCPETYTWHLLTDEIRQRLNEKKYQRFNPVLDAKDVDEFDLYAHLDNVIVLTGNKICTFEQYCETNDINDPEEHELLLEYGKLVGKTTAHRMVYVKM